MRLLARILFLVLLLGVSFVGLIFAASEFGGEGVVLHTHDGSADRTTHLWVVDDGGFAWLRAGVPGTGWLKRIEANPDVTVERGGQTFHFRAVPIHEPAIRDRIHELMRQKYAWADKFVSMLRDPKGSVPVRLEPVAPPATPAPAS
ncbi:MAG TPA: nitroreductase/quinone reductase family protein [Myxococcota bacterium]|nr:nitroreductase/quinone reductase family protein [Myxococcota bacterium]